MQIPLDPQNICRSTQFLPSRAPSQGMGASQACHLGDSMEKIDGKQIVGFNQPPGAEYHGAWAQPSKGTVSQCHTISPSQFLLNQPEWGWPTKPWNGIGIWWYKGDTHGRWPPPIIKHSNGKRQNLVQWLSLKPPLVGGLPIASGEWDRTSGEFQWCNTVIYTGVY